MPKLIPSLLSILLVSLASSSAVEIIGHRGASQDAPENTVASFKLGWEQRADADELDIYLTKDGQVVVIHDATTKRTTGVDKKVVESTLEELQALDSGTLKGAQWAGEKIPTLAAAPATVPDGKRMFIEIKSGPEILPALDKVLKASGKKPAQLAIIGFGYETMQQAKKMFPELPVFWLASYKEDKVTGKGPDIDDLIARTKSAGLDGLDLHFKFPIDAAFVTKVKSAGLKLYTWTVDDPVVARKLVEAGVDGITTDRPGWLREQLGTR